MPKNDVVNFSKYFNLPNPGLKTYFGTVRSGQDEIFSSPWLKGSNEQKLNQLDNILKEWMQELKPLESEWPTLYSFEMDLAAKVGPMSVMKPLKNRMKDIDAYYEDILRPAEPVANRAIKAVESEFSRVKGTIPRSVRKTVDKMKKSTNSGSPYFAKRRTVTDKTVPFEITGDIMSLPSGDWNYAAVLGWRGQEGGPAEVDVKQRVVWMFPYAVNIAELQAYQPLIEASQRFNLVPAWGSMDQVDIAITKMFDTKHPDDVVICTDFTKFDQHFNSTLQDCAHSILHALLSPVEASRNWLNKIFPIKYCIPLAYDYGKIRVGKHGMGSGSGGTNFDETIVHRALQYEAAQSVGKRLNPYSQCLGDDGVLTYPGITVDDVMRSYTRHGLDMNPDKQYVSTQDCIYLRRWHHVNYRVDGVCAGVYSTARALGRLCMQERYYDPEDWGPRMVALRQLSILENIKYHPYAEKFVEFCMKRDKFRLGLDIPGFLDDIEQIAQEAIDHMPDFLGYTKSLQDPGASGISTWWIVNYLKSKR